MDHKLETLIVYNLSKIQVQESVCAELSGTLLSTLSRPRPTETKLLKRAGKPNFYMNFTPKLKFTTGLQMSLRSYVKKADSHNNPFAMGSKATFIQVRKLRSQFHYGNRIWTYGVALVACVHSYYSIAPQPQDMSTAPRWLPMSSSMVSNVLMKHIK